MGKRASFSAEAPRGLIPTVPGSALCRPEGGRWLGWPQSPCGQRVPPLTRKLLHLDQGVLSGRALQELLRKPAAACLQEPENRAGMSLAKRKLNPKPLMPLALTPSLQKTA